VAGLMVTGEIAQIDHEQMAALGPWTIVDRLATVDLGRPW
jgi:hypothetical protein